MDFPLQHHPETSFDPPAHLFAEVLELAGRGAAVSLHGGRGRLEVRGDAAWLARAIGNLIDNARVHGEGGAITIELGRDENEVYLRVRNPGQVKAAVRGRLFRRFVTTRADRGGTGLGLAIARAIAEAHRGTLRCTALGPPEVCFELRLPAAG